MKPTPAMPRGAPSHVYDRGQSATIFGAAAEVFSAGQQLLVDRVDLLQAEVTSDVKRLGVAAALFVSALAIVWIGWVILAVGLAAALSRWLPLDGALGISGGLNVALGALLGGLGYKRLSQPTAFERPAPLLEEHHA